ncbi:copper-binding protein [Alcaligenes endophyticus]
MVTTISAQAQEARAKGEVRRIDAANGKITIKHGAIGQLELPAMTLVYLIEPALLVGIAPGDTVTFVAARKNDQYVVVSISK